MSKWTDEEIRELCVWAAPGPWESNYAGDVLTQSGGQIADFVPYEGNREFIAAARELVPQLLDRALKAEAELRRCYKDMEELTAERNDLKSILTDAGLRNAVLQRRVDRLIDVLYLDHEQLPEGYCETPPDGVDCELAYECRKCWREWLEQEVQP